MLRPRNLLLALAGLLVVWFGLGRLLPTAVDTVPVERRELVQSVVATGRVRSLSRARLGADLSGTVERVLVREGDLVRPGQVLVQLEDRESRAQVAQARAALAQAEAAVAGIGEVRQAVAEATLRSADVALARAEADFQRMQRLVDAGASAADQLDLARQSLEAARSQRDIARAQLRASGGGGSDRRGADANLEQARGALALAEARLANTRVVSPGAGRILTRDVEPGDAVQTGRVLLTMALDGPTQLVAVPDEKDVSRLAEGQPAVASADPYPDQAFPARVSYVAPSIDPEQGTVEVRLDVDSAPPFLRPDMTVSVQIETARRPAALTVPLAAIREPLSRAPWVLRLEGGRAVRRDLTLGVRGEVHAEVLTGLEEGDRIVAASARGVVAGDRIRARSGTR